MDIWKLLILVVVVVGVVLVLSQPPPLPKLPAGQRVEEGTFRVTTPQGSWEELFGVYPVDAGFRVVGIVHQKGNVLLEADLLYDPTWRPLAGAIIQRVPQEVRYLYAFTNREVLVRVQRGARERVETITAPEGTLLWELEIMSTWYALLRAVPRENRLSLFSCMTHRTWDGQIGEGKEVRLRSLGRELPATLRSLAVHAQEFEVFHQGDLLLGVRGPNLSAHLLEVLPEGFQT